MGGANDLDSAIGRRLCPNKRLAAALLRTAGLPIPIHREAASPEEALSVAEVLGWPVVVKPADRDRGEEVTVNITTPTELHSAWQKARTFSANILVERQIEKSSQPTADHCRHNRSQLSGCSFEPLMSRVVLEDIDESAPPGGANP